MKKSLLVIAIFGMVLFGAGSYRALASACEGCPANPETALTAGSVHLLDNDPPADSLFADDPFTDDPFTDDPFTDDPFADDPFADEFFGEVLIVDDATSMVDHAWATLDRDPLSWGGNWRFNVSLNRPLETGSSTTLRPSFTGQLYLDARPDPNTRMYVSGSADLKLSGDTTVDLSLDEWFGAWNYDNQLYLRAGKQNVSWGVGYFFNPADLISVGRLDPQNPDAAREGPVALRVHYPQRYQDYYLFVLFDGVSTLQDVAAAPRISFVQGRSEWSIGGFYQQEKAPRVSFTLSSSVRDIAFFAEGAASLGSDRTFVEIGSDGSLRTTEREGLHTAATVGMRTTYEPLDELLSLTFAAQYFFNGEGYKDTTPLYDPRLPLLLLDGSLAVSDLIQTGRHYAALSGSIQRIFDTRFALLGFWLGNLSDRSGQITANISHRGRHDLRPSVGVTWFYGKEDSEFGRGSSSIAVRAGYSMSF